MFLSKSFIENRVRFFAEALENEILKWDIIKKKKKKIKEEIGTIEIKDVVVDNIKEINNKEKEEGVKHNKKDKFKSKEENKIIQNSSVRKEKIETKPSQVDIFLSSLWKSVKDFFSTNTIAKLWWILVFLTVIYFLKWVASNIWEIIWPVWRIVLGFIVWFLSYGIWIKLHLKSLKNEWLILMWVWILINYAVILAWRYIVWDNWYLSEGTTFFFLILNTVFWVITSLVYKSKILLIFSFIFGYLNPFIIWSSSNWEPYTLVWYSLIISLWALFISYKQKDLKLLFISFIFWNLLFLLAPFSDSIWWVSKIILATIKR
jgi:cation transport ATPase